MQKKLTVAVATLVPVLAVLVLGCSPPPAGLPTATVVLDRSPSGADFVASMRARVIAFIDETVRSGDFSALDLVGVGGGPRDVLTVTVTVGCEGTDRQCADSARVERVVTEAVAALDSLLATPLTVSGSGPVGATWNVLSSAGAGDHVLVLSDFVEHSDVFDLVDSVPLSTPEERAAVIDQIATSGAMDFSVLELDDVTIDVELVPGELSGQAPARFEQMRLFAEELLGVKASLLDLTVVAA